MVLQAIKIEEVSKRYYLGTRGPQYGLIDRVKQAVGLAPKRVSEPNGTSGNAPRGMQEFWALKDLSFDVGQGEVVGVIGRNGAGKSTLLKILSRITEPTSGRIEIRGRVGSLLEVGTGFHPELTGRENIFLNGAILGMSQAEIRRNLDEIVAFAEIDKFLDTPVKRYSSGMYVRLAFAVAAHLQPEILIVDEVLAVGDVNFQAKCMGKMNTISQTGRTILFVSHNLNSVARLCSRVVWLDHGQIVRSGPSSEVVDEYLSRNTSVTGTVEWPDGVSNPGVKEFSFQSASVLNSRGDVTTELSTKEPFQIELKYRVHEEIANCRIGFVLTTAENTPVFETYDVDLNGIDARRTPGEYVTRCTIPADLVNAGRYYVSLNCRTAHQQSFAWVVNVLALTLVDPEQEVGGVWTREGTIRPRLSWEVQQC
ncbi:MAG: ABC transporter ATP-binding protein [Planctomycetales bacterium]